MPSSQKEEEASTPPTSQTHHQAQDQTRKQASIAAILDDEDYNSEDDSDFAPGIDDDDDDDANDSDSDSDDSSRQPSPKPAAVSATSSEIVTKQVETTIITATDTKTTLVAKNDNGDGDENFKGDPAEEPELDETIEGEIEDTGPGGEIKTRAQRAKEQEQRKAFKTTAPVKADSSVDSIWEQMKASWRPAAISPASESTPTPPPTTTTTAPAPPPKEETYIFAGEVVSTTTTKSTTTTTTKPLTSASSSTGNKLPLRRPKRRSSIFDTDPPSQPKAKKLNTLEKSKLDWIGFTKTEGLEEELEKHGKGGKGYIERQNFLDRTGRRI